jgi:predicted kinase
LSLFSDTQKGLLIVFGGLPGTGKTSIAKELSSRLHSLYLRIDTIEQALLRENGLSGGHEGYMVAYAVAEDNLRAGNVVIADSVNPLPITRDAWHSVAKRTSSDILEIEVICSDQAEHRRRVEERKADIAGHTLPIWDEVVHRDYQAWPTKNLTIDTARQSVHDAVENALHHVAVVRGNHREK